MKVFIFKLSAVGLPAVACVLAVDTDPDVADVHVVTESPALVLVNAVAGIFSVVGLLLLVSLHHAVAVRCSCCCLFFPWLQFMP